MREATARTEDSAAAKRRQILAGARQAFGEMGYERASVDLVASRAGVSKATVYNHFADKRALFVACFAEAADDMRADFLASMGEPQGDVEEALRALGERFLRVILSREVVAMWRHTLADVCRFPEVGAALFDRGPSVVYARFASYLARWHERGALRVPDPALAAVQLVLLLQGDLVARAHLGVLALPAAEDEIRRTVAAAVSTFLRAYRA